jgi:PAS domain S-box-containing protein
VTPGDDTDPRVEAVLDERAEDLFEQAPCGYLSTRPDGTILKVNQTLLDWTGHTRERLLGGVRFQTLLTIGSRIYYETHYAPLLQMQGAAHEIALDLLCAGGRILPAVVNSRQLSDASGVPLVNRITLFDSTDRRRYERELLLARRKAEQAAKDKSDLLAMLSHDIRNPLGAVMGVVHMLEASALDDGQARLVRLLKSSSASMLQLLNHVLELSRAESANFALVETPFSILELVEDVVATFQAKAREKPVEMRFRADARVPAVVVGDPVAIRQIVTNLVGNAVKFTERGHVEVSIATAELAADAVTLAFAVADTGIGIAPAVVDRIFNEFTQASYDTVLKFGGSGLGLTIIRKLLALYGSQVHIDSVPGQGSTFSFRLKLAMPPAQPASVS